MKYGVSPQRLKEAPVEKLENMIKMVCFHRNKAKYLKKTAEIVLEKYNGIVPRELNELQEFPGIGPISALMIQTTLYGKVSGLPMDSQSLRVSNRLKWVDSQKPKLAQKQLESWLPKEKWPEAYELLLGLGNGV
jgi:endonuclease III